MASFIVALSALCLVLAASPAMAGIFGGCDRRPGTPVDMTATQSDNQIFLDFTNTAREAPIYWDIEVTDGAGHYLAGNVAGVQGTRTQATGGQYSELGRFRLTAIQGGDFHAGIQYCFRVRARTQAGTQGCTSEIWNNPVCVTTPSPDVDQFCSTYARDAINQLNYLRNVKYRGDCGDEGDRWSSDWLAHYNWCIAVRANQQTAGAPDYEREERNKRIRVCSNYECFNSVCKQLKPEKPIKSVRTPQPTPSPPPAVSVSQCNYTVWVTNDECVNVDGTPMAYNPAGVMRTFGCGATVDEALQRAKTAFQLEEGPKLSDEDEPCPGCCTYTKTVANSCACPISTYSYTRKVIVEPCLRGLIRTAAGDCRCPPGTQWIGMRCRSILPASKPAPIQRLPAATTVNVCPSWRPVGVWPHCCPIGTRFSRGVCRRSTGTTSGPGTGGTNGTKLNTGAVCLGARPVGVWPNCCPIGTRFSRGVCRRSGDTTSGPGAGGSNGTKPNTTTCPRSRPVGNYPNCCPRGTVYSGHRCRPPPGSRTSPGTNSGSGSGSGSSSKPAPTGPTPKRICPSGLTGPNCDQVIVH